MNRPTELDEKLKIIKRNTEEIVTEKELIALLEREKSFKFYHGIAPTGPFHIGYLVPLGKVIDCIKAGGEAIILIADYHAYLDDQKTPWEKIENRATYCQRCIELTLKDYLDKIEIVRGSTYQTKKEYVEDVFKAAAWVTIERAKRAASQVCRMRKPKVSELLYPIMQVIDVKALGVDMAIGGIDQRHIYMLGRDVIFPKLGLKPEIDIFTPLIASLRKTEEKMSSSIPGSHIKVHDSPETIITLVSKAYCPPAVSEKNPIIDIAKHIIFPLRGLLYIEREEKYGGPVEYRNYEKLENDYINGKLHPRDLKNGVARTLIDMFKDVRKFFEKHEDLLEAALVT